jgi:hypothetical protein
MEPSGRNQWQPVANGAAAKVASSGRRIALLAVCEDVESRVEKLEVVDERERE